jgi:fibronectin type 3 domain-containing protein
MSHLLSHFSLKQPTLCILAVATILLLSPGAVSAQAPPVPSTFQDLYTELDNYLINFNASLPAGNGTSYPTVMVGALKTADANIGPAMLGSLPGMNLQLNALKAMGVQAIMLEIGFPMLYQPFMTSQNANYQQYSNYYQAVATAVRAAGLKLIVENDTLLVNDVQAGWDAAPFYATLNWTQYQQARAAAAVTIVQLLQPDYMVLVEEPNTESNDSGQSEANTPEGSYALVSQMLTAVKEAGVPNVKYGAGTATSQQNAVSFIQQYVTLPLDFIDFHSYPINENFLPIALQIASTAASAGLPVAMSECWLSKERDTEVGLLTTDQVRARDPFSFWAPLDAYFVQTMQNLANSTQMLFLVPFDSQYFFTYLPYDATTENLSAGAIIGEENAAVQSANLVAQYSSTGMSYYNSMVVPADTTPPSTPPGLAGVSSNPTGASISWNAATDNVGVAGYYLLRNGQVITTTATLYFQDTGLTEATNYTYTVEAFDLAGNVSAPSAPVTVQTVDSSPPTTPGNVATQAVSCTRANLTWSASQDNTGVTQYLIWMGLSPSSLTQAATAGGSVTSYSNTTLSPATTYYFGIEAEDKNHNISYMSVITPVTTPALPVAPPSVLATADSGSKVVVTWSPSTGGLPIAHYMVYRGTSSSSLSKIATLSGTTFTDMTVTAGTTYYYAIQAGDSGSPPAQSGLSSPVSVTTYSPPSVPANLAGAASSCKNVTVSWSAAVSGGLPIANYHVYKGSSAANLTQVAVTTKTSYTDTTDAAQTTYYYAVQATDTGTPADVSAISSPVAVTTYGYPSVPGNLTATPVSSSKITVSWSAATSGGLAISSYHVYGGTSPSSLTQLAVTKSTTYTNTSLTPGTTYYYAVQAFDTANDSSAISTVVSATTLALPTTPANVAAQGVSSSKIAVNWSPSSGALPIQYYYVFRGTSPSSLSQIGTTSSTTYSDRSASSGTTYYYGIQAGDTAGDRSPISPAVAGATQP